jgi:hypothetical protein
MKSFQLAKMTIRRGATSAVRTHDDAEVPDFFRIKLKSPRSRSRGKKRNYDGDSSEDSGSGDGDVSQAGRGVDAQLRL